MTELNLQLAGNRCFVLKLAHYTVLLLKKFRCQCAVYPMYLLFLLVVGL